MTTTDAKHTPLPWHTIVNDLDQMILITTEERSLGQKVPIAKIELGFDEPFESHQRANAAYIVKAVNSHEALLKALRYIDLTNDNPARYSSQIDQIVSAALKIAGE
jgi:hypothetical protein